MPLAITAGVHLLLAGLWMAASTRPPKAGDARPALQVLWLKPPAPQPKPQVERKTRRATPTVGRALPTPPAAPAVAVPLAATPDPLPEPAARPNAAELLAAARQSAGAIDRDLRASKQAPLQGAGAWSRFESKVAAAKVNHARGVSTETYVAPDGTVTYRTRNGDRVYCRRSGGVAPGLEPTQGQLLASGGAIGGLSTAGNVRCPSQDPGFKP